MECLLFSSHFYWHYLHCSCEHGSAQSNVPLKCCHFQTCSLMRCCSTIALTLSGPHHWAISQIWPLPFDVFSKSNFCALCHVALSVWYLEHCWCQLWVAFFCFPRLPPPHSFVLFPERWHKPTDFFKCGWGSYRWKWCWVSANDGESCHATSFLLDIVKSLRITSEARISVLTAI